MKRLVIALAIVATLGIVSPGLPTLAQPTQIPHENPATARGSLDKVALLLSYCQTINLAANGQYQDALDLLNELKSADIPDELKYIIDHYSRLCRELFDTLDNLESLLNEASARLSRHQIGEVKQMLDDAGADIQNARLLLKDLRIATAILSNELGVFAISASNPLEAAYTRLEEILERLRQLLDRLDNLQHSLTERYTQIEKLIPTELSLSVNPASPFVGDTVTASGRLSGNGEPLANRKLTLTLNNQPIAVTTQPDGAYITGITIPYIYVDTITLTAAYEPSGDDAGKYLASQSPPVTINTRFYRTRLEVSAPETVHPGLPFTLSGRLSSTGGETERTVRVLLDNALMAETTAAGQFRLKLTPPEPAPTGEHSLTVSVTPQGRYSGATETRTVNISKLPVYVDAQTPKIVLLPEAVHISGRVYHESGPAADARLSLSFRDTSSTVRTAADGVFTASLEAPLDLSLTGPQELTLTATPVEPWLTPLTVKRRLFTINPLSTGLILAVLAALGVLAYRRRRTQGDEINAVLPTEVTPLPAMTPAPEAVPGISGIRGRILSAYRGGLEAVERVTGTGMAPHVTLREFLKTATLAPAATGQFAELTAIAEITLYSESNPREDTAARAEHLAATIREELHHGTA